MSSAVPQPDPVHALAAAPDFATSGLCFAGRGSGLQRSTDGGRTWVDAYAAMQLQAPLTTASLAFSPDFVHDRTLFAGAFGGVLRSQDGGQHWTAASLPTPPPFVATLAFSPHYVEDGLVFAGATEDGVFRSWDRGASWAAWNFGLLDLNVYALAISPAFARDDTLFAGVESGIFRSSNGGRAWRELGFPMELAPVLSLAISPAFADDGVLFAGTEAHGLFRSNDRGDTWTPVATWPASGTVNGLWPAPDFSADLALLAMAGDGLHLTRDGGLTWTSWVVAEQGDAGLTCNAAPAGLAPGAPLLVGLSDGRVVRDAIPDT